MHHISQFDIFHNRELTRFALAFGVNTGAGLLKGGGILYFSQPYPEDLTPKDSVGTTEASKVHNG